MALKLAAFEGESAIAVAAVMPALLIRGTANLAVEPHGAITGIVSVNNCTRQANDNVNASTNTTEDHQQHRKRKHSG